MTAASLVWASCVVAQDPCNDTGSVDLTVPVGVGLAVLAVVAVAIVLVLRRLRPHP